MGNETSAGAVVFRHKDSPVFILLHYEGGHWGLPRGNIEGGETELITAAREIQEETGITDITFQPGFKEKVNWFYMRDGDKIFKEATFFLAETTQEEITLSSEHIGYVWASYEGAMRRLTFENARNVLTKAKEFLEK